MKVLVIGNGAREHTLIWKISQSKNVSKIYAAPGNGGISELAECVDIEVTEIDKLTDFARQNQVNLTVVGPEAPLVAGIVDTFEKCGLKVFGPDKKAAQLEGSKSFSKDFMQKYNIPTARYKTYNNSETALQELDEYQYPLVVKADGLAAGKGVIICQDKKMAEEAVQNIMTDRKFGDAGNLIVIEEFLTGIEASLLCFVGGNKIIPMESARDYKKIYDNDEGLNTGGMGCFSPNPVFNKDLNEQIKDEILDNIIKGFEQENINYKGVIFIGLMIKENKAKVLEFNVRFGDPEAEVVLPRLESDLIGIILKTMNGSIRENDLQWSEKSSVCVIAASGGYPGNYEKEIEISGIENLDPEIIVFHGGTKLANGKLRTNGGRVLGITALGNTIEKARNLVYSNIDKIQFDGMFYRKDIGNV